MGFQAHCNNSRRATLLGSISVSNIVAGWVMPVSLSQWETLILNPNVYSMWPNGVRSLALNKRVRETVLEILARPFKPMQNLSVFLRFMISAVMGKVGAFIKITH